MAFHFVVIASFLRQDGPHHIKAFSNMKQGVSKKKNFFIKLGREARLNNVNQSRDGRGEA
jgi:hypothetical protein